MLRGLSESLPVVLGGYMPPSQITPLFTYTGKHFVNVTSLHGPCAAWFYGLGGVWRVRSKGVVKCWGGGVMWLPTISAWWVWVLWCPRTLAGR